MGQYHICCNLSKKEFLDPHKLGCGLKLWEQANNRGVREALIMLTAASSGRGGGDFDNEANPEVIGRWAGDRIAFVGDYAKDSDLPQRFRAHAIYDRIRRDQERQEKGKPPVKRGAWTDISDVVAKALEVNNEMIFFGQGWKGSAQLSEIIHGWTFSHSVDVAGKHERVVDIPSESLGVVQRFLVRDVAEAAKAKLDKLSGESGYDDPTGIRYGVMVDKRTGARTERHRLLNVHELGLKPIEQLPKIANVFAQPHMGA